MNGKNEATKYFENITVVITGIFLLAFPLFMLTSTTDVFVLPKQILLGGVTLLLLVLHGGKMIAQKSVKLTRTPFDVPLILFTVCAFLSSLLSVNRADSLIAFVGLLLAILLYFIITNTIKTENQTVFAISSVIVSACVLSLLTILSFFKIYILPFEFTKALSFSPLGSLLDQAIYIAIVLPLSLSFAYPLLKTRHPKEFSGQMLAGLITSIIIAMGLFITAYQLVKPATGPSQLTILPFEHGFQTAFAAISQDTGRLAQGFFFGSGFGTYFTDFARFKAVSYNVHPTLWSFTFFRSSSFVLEILATTGILGLAAFLFLAVRLLKNSFAKKTHGIFGKTAKNPVAVSVVFGFLACVILPFGFTTYTLFFILLAIYAAAQVLQDDEQYFDIELHFVAFKKGIIPLSTTPASADKMMSKLLPSIFFGLFVVIAAVLGYQIIQFVRSDIALQNSLIAAQTNGMQSYQLQNQALTIFPYRDLYHRVFAQTNLALANNLAAQQQPNATVSAETQQTIAQLVQQSINAARRATAISSQTALNWENLSSIYRNMIGYGQNAENFAILASQQAIVLNPNNPQGYLNLGGIYYQLGQWDNAQRQFQIALNLKPDFANAYYNLGHALESKGDLPGAVTQYETVKSLVSADSQSLAKISQEIDTLKGKIESEKVNAQNAQIQQTSDNQQPLGINTPKNQLPQQNPPVKIPGPSGAVPSPSPTPTP